MNIALLIIVALAQPQSCAVPLANVRIHDGDTIHASLDLPFGITIRDKTIRAADYDAYELTRARRTVNVTPVEIERGKRAKAALEDLFAQGQPFAVDTGKQDAYGRLLAVLWVKTRDGRWVEVSRFMEREGHTRSPVASERQPYPLTTKDFPVIPAGD